MKIFFAKIFQNVFKTLFIRSQSQLNSVSFEIWLVILKQVNKADI